MKKLISRLFLLSFFVLLATSLSSCTSELLSNDYVGILDDGTEVKLSSGSIQLDKYQKYIFSTTSEEIEGETISCIDFNFYSDETQEITFVFAWKYETTLYGTEVTKELGEYKATVYANTTNQISYEIPEDLFFTIKNNKPNQKLIIDVTSEEAFNNFLDKPEVLTLGDNSSEALADELDKNLEE